jgi:3'(2'),5'-bisphosphate nucleotidase
MSVKNNQKSAPVDLPGQLTTLVEIALAAGAVIMAVYRTDFSVETKADDSPVTEADQRAEEIIVAALKANWPTIEIVAEEAVSAGYIAVEADQFFLVDPLDGTQEFLHRRGDFTVNIALIENGVPIRGVVFAPAKNRIFAGDINEGAYQAMTTETATGDFVLGEFTAARIKTADDAGLDIVASRSHRTPETDRFCENYAVKGFQSAGSSLKFCLLACGEADLYPRLGRTMEWDTAAGDAILRAAGGSVVTLNGDALQYGKRDQADDVDFANPWFIALGDCTLRSAGQ